MSLTKLERLCWLINGINRAPDLISKQTAQRLLEFQLLRCKKKTRQEEARVVELEYLLLVIPGLDKIFPLVPVVLLIQEL